MRVAITIDHTEAADGARTSVEVDARNEFGESVDPSYSLLVGVLELAKFKLLDMMRGDEIHEEDE